MAKDNLRNDEEVPYLDKARRAFEKLRKRLEAIRAEEVVAPKVDIGRAVGVALAAEPKIQRYADAIKEELPRFDITMVENLELTALAAWYAHASAPPAESDPLQVRGLVEEATQVRRDLLTQANALAARGLVDAKRAEAIEDGRGNVDLAQDLVAIRQLFLDRWGDVEKKTPVTRQELDRAADLGTRLMRALGARERPVVAEGELDPAELRIRAFVLLAKHYDQIRRALTYIRWDEDDVNEIAPSIFAGSRTTSRRSNDKRIVEDDVADDAPVNGSPGPVDGAPADVAPAVPAPR